MQLTRSTALAVPTLAAAIVSEDLRRLPLKSVCMNTLYFGDNLEILTRHISDESVDLIYLDPPFNSNRDYNVLFREQSGSESPAQIKAFGDTWNWAGAAAAWDDFTNLCPVPKVIELMHGFHNAIGENDVLAYLVMMAPRLYHLHRVLKPTGSLYLHCDPTASAYLRLILDCIFGAKNFKNEITWKRSSAHNDTRQGMRRCGKIRDILFFYTKSPNQYTWNPLYMKYAPDYFAGEYRHITPDGRFYKETDLTAAKPGGDTGYEWYVKRPTANKKVRWLADLTEEYRTPQPGWEYKAVKPYNGRFWAYSKANLLRFHEQGCIIHRETGMPRLMQFADEMQGIALQDLWDDIPPVSSSQSLGYPTQKPLALLERIIASSSNPGDVVLDPFCGCGTAIVAAQKLERQWIGIDITPIATSLVQKRLFDSFGAKDARLLSKDDPAQRIAFDVEGLPTDLTGAKLLYDKDPTHKDFEMWAVGLIPAIPQEKKGADRGIDGIAYFHDNPKKPSKAVVQVKGGHVTANQIRDLIGVMHTEKAQLGFFISLEAPTQPMRSAALAAGYYQPPSGVGRRVEALQIRTIEDLLEGRNFDFPLFGSNVSYQQAEQMRAAKQEELEI